MLRNFNNWLLTFRKSINNYSYYTDFNKIYRNIALIKVEINILNSIIGSTNIEEDFINILLKYPECLKVIPILLAVRSNEIYCQDENGTINYKFDNLVNSIEQYKYFMRKTGLFDMMQNHIISNLQDYITGIETGLDSNCLKHRGGQQMEQIVENYIKQIGVEYYKEIKNSMIKNKWNIDLSTLLSNNISNKRWDFIVKTNNYLYAIETNFYNVGGSKLNEIARSYKYIAEKSNNIPNFKFVWITDGLGWKSARKNLNEVFNILETIYNIEDLENGLLNLLFT